MTYSLTAELSAAHRHTQRTLYETAPRPAPQFHLDYSHPLPQVAREMRHQKLADSSELYFALNPLDSGWGITGRHHQPGFTVYLPETEPKDLSYLHMLRS